MKTFIQSGTGSTATLQEANPSKIRVFDTYEDAEAAISSIKENEIVCIKEASDEQVRDATVPVGTIVSYLSDTIPDGWLLCDGSDIPEKYVRLRELIGTKTPDLRNKALMGAGTNGALGDDQSDTTAVNGLEVNTTSGLDGYFNAQPNSLNSFTTTANGIVSAVDGVFTGYTNAGTGSAAKKFYRIDANHTHTLTGDDETRPKNIRVNWIIKAAPNQSEVQDIEMNMPVGSLISYRGQTTPVGFLRADGSTFDKDKYPLLYTALGNSNVLPTEIEYPEFSPEAEDITSTVNVLVGTAKVVRVENVIQIMGTSTPSATGWYTPITGLPKSVINMYGHVNTDNSVVTTSYIGNAGQDLEVLAVNTQPHHYSLTYITDEFDGEAKYKYIKATSGIEAEEETIATAVNEAVAKALSKTGVRTRGISSTAQSINLADLCESTICHVTVAYGAGYEGVYWENNGDNFAWIGTTPATSIASWDSTNHVLNIGRYVRYLIYS